MGISLRRGARLPDAVKQALALGPRERVLSFAAEEAGGRPTGTTVVATTHGLYAVDATGTRVVARPWHEVDAGSWSAELHQLTVTWVDRATPAQWVLGDSSLLPETLRERVQASVVLAQKLEVGPRRSARAVIRQDLATGDLVEQVVLGRNVRADDPEVALAADEALDYLREQVGLS